MSGLDDDLSRARTELGEPESLFQVSPGWFRAKLVVAVGLLLYGVVANYLWWFHGPRNGGHFVIHFLIWPPGVGAALLWHMYRNRGLFVLLYPTGLLRLRRGEVDSFPWPEIEQVRLRLKKSENRELTRGPDGQLLAAWLAVDVPAVQIWTAGFTVVRADGREAHFGPALADYPVLAEEVQRRTFTALWPGVWAGYLAGEGIAFGVLEVTLTGIRHAKKSLPWREFKELSIAQGRLTIKQDGRWLPWALVDVGGIPNPHILFALVGEARRLRMSLTSQPQAEPVDNGERPA